MCSLTVYVMSKASSQQWAIREVLGVLKVIRVFFTGVSAHSAHVVRGPLYICISFLQHNHAPLISCLLMTGPYIYLQKKSRDAKANPNILS